MSYKDIDAVREALYGGSAKKFILDTDTYNEIDDQFALAWSLLTDRAELLSVNAAPFFNNRSSGPEDGMIKSYDEILNIMKLVGRSVPAYRGSVSYLPNKKTAVESDAADNIINTARGFTHDDPLYVLAIGAITNVASALIKAPEIKDSIVVVWLGGNGHHCHDTREFNLIQDVPAAKVIFDSGVRLVQLPCAGVVDHLATTMPELKYYLKGKNSFCDYLVDIVDGYGGGMFWSKVIWDISTVAALVCPKSLDLVIKPTPFVTADGTYSFSDARHPMIYCRALNRDMIFSEMYSDFTK